MAERKRVIRRVEQASVADFDEQLWPINCLLLIMAAMVAGLVLASKPSFDPPRFDHTLFKNGWVLLTGLAVIVAGLLLGTVLFQRRAATRRMQFAVLLAILLHLWLAIGMYVIPIHISSASPQDGVALPDEDSPQTITIPDYGRVMPEAQFDPLTQPIETVVPEQEQQITRQQQAVEVPSQRPRDDQPAAVRPIPQPQPLEEMPRAESSAPHRAASPAASQLSRSETADHRAPAAQPAPQMAAPRPAEAQSQSALEATAASQRQQVQTATAQRQTDASAAVTPRVEAQAMMRRTSEAPALPSARPSLARQQPADLPQETPAAQPAENPAAAAPQVAQAQRELEASSTVQRMNAPAVADAQRSDIQYEATQPAATPSTAAMQQARLAQATPQLNAAERTAANRSPAAATPEVEVAQAPAGAAPATMASRQPTLQAAEMAMQRSQAQAAIAAQRPGAVSELAQATSTPDSAGQASLPRADATAATQPAATGPTAATLARTTTADPAAASGGLAGEAIAADAPAARSGTEVVSTATLQPGGAAPSRMMGQQVAAANRQTAGDGAELSANAAAPTVSGISRAGQQNTGEPSVAVGSQAQLMRSNIGIAVGGGPTPQAPQIAAAAPSNAAAGSQASQVDASQQTTAGRIVGGSSDAVAAARGAGTTGGLGPNLEAGGTPAAARGTAGSGPNLAMAQNVGGALGRAQANPSLAGVGDAPAAAADSPATTHAGAGPQGDALATADPAARATRQGIAGLSVARADTGSIGSDSLAGGETAANMAAAARGNSETPQVGTATGQTGSLQRQTSGIGFAPEVAAAPAAGMNGGPQSEDAGPSGSSAVALDAGLEPGASVARREAGPAPIAANRGSGGAEGVATGSLRSPAGSELARAASPELDGPQLGSGNRGTLARQSGLPGLPADEGAADLAEAPGPQPGAAGAAMLADGNAGEAGPTFERPSQQMDNRLAVKAPSDSGVGGLRQDRTPEAGLPHRMARLESQTLTPTTDRFILEKSTTPLSAQSPIRPEPAPAFQNRDLAERQRIASRRGGTAESERAVELGLDFLARHQSSDGRWSLHAFGAGRGYRGDVGHGMMQSDTAGTGLSLLAFLGAGYTHQADKYRNQVAAGLQFLIEHQRPDGDLFSALGGNRYAWLYSHGIATIALCEAYGMTRDPALKDPAQRALDFIAAAQNRAQGGWRYAPGVGSDTSVSGWQLMALKSGQMAGLHVEPKVLEGVRGWLAGARWSGDNSLYVYRPGAPQEHQRTPSAAMTAEAMLMQLYLGEGDARTLTRGAAYLRARLPSIGARPGDRDAYYWYYATQVMFHLQGEHWETWNARLRPLLTRTQVQEGPLAGSWHPSGRIPDRWGPQAGRIYVTALHLLMLEVYYRHLPLFGERVLDVAQP